MADMASVCAILRADWLSIVANSAFAHPVTFPFNRGFGIIVHAPWFAHPAIHVIIPVNKRYAVHCLKRMMPNLVDRPSWSARSQCACRNGLSMFAGFI